MQKNIYLERYANPKKYLNPDPPEDLGIVLVIPAYKEPDVVSTLTSLLHCDKPQCHVEIIVVLNFSEHDSDKVKTETRSQYLDLTEWVKHNSTTKFSFYIIFEEDIQHKIAGPGMARKIGMDEAVRRFEHLNIKDGIITCLDADCAVAKNYLTEIYRHWQDNPETNGISIYFEHPTEGSFQESVYNGIIDYELHLRYYINAQSFAGFPMAYQTVGSSFAVSSGAYQKQGGMNKRKAGEDFYFIHKIIPLGNYFNLLSTAVYPSPRPSDRVPFGTGRTISDYLMSNRQLTTYNIETFKDLKCFLSSYMDFFHSSEKETKRLISHLPRSITQFLGEQHFQLHLQKINQNSASEITFAKGFFRWFDAFRLMKYVHFARDNYYPNEPIGPMAKSLLKLNSIEILTEIPNKELLCLFRKLDKGVIPGQKDFSLPSSY